MAAPEQQREPRENCDHQQVQLVDEWEKTKKLGVSGARDDPHEELAEKNTGSRLQPLKAWSQAAPLLKMGEKTFRSTSLQN